MGPRSFQIQIWGPKRVPTPHWIKGALQLLFYKVFAKTHCCGSRDTPYPLYTLHTQGLGVLGWNTPKNLPPLEDHLHANLHQDPSSVLDFYKEHTHTLPPRAQIKKQKNMYLLNFTYLCMGRNFFIPHLFYLFVQTNPNLTKLGFC